jgi:hypothetical protein
MMIPLPSIVRRSLGCLALVALFSALGGPPGGHLGGVRSASASGPCDPNPTPCVLIAVNLNPNPPCDCPWTFDPSSIVVDPATQYQLGLANQLTTTAVVTGPAGNVVAVLQPGATATLRVPGPGSYQFSLTRPTSPGGLPPSLVAKAQQQG